MKNSIGIIAFCICCFPVASLFAQKEDTAIRLKKMTGKWNVTNSIRPSAGAEQTLIKGIVAERSMTGDYCLTEVMILATESKTESFKRISNFAYNLNQQRWDYMSVDSRITAGIMNFQYLDSKGDSIVSFIESFPHPGFGPEMKDRGLDVYTRNVIVKINDNHDQVKQYWRLTDKKEWLAVIYDYTRL